MKQYDYIVVNDVLDFAVENVHNVIVTEHCKRERQGQLIEQMTEELKLLGKELV